MARTLLLAAPPLALLVMAVLVVAAMATDNTYVSQLTSKNTIEATAATPPPPPSSSSSSPQPPPPPPPPSPLSSSSSSPQPPPPSPSLSSSFSFSSSFSSSSSSSSPPLLSLSSSSSPSSSPPFSEQKTLTPEQIKGFYKGMSREFVNEHNKVRARYEAGPLTWDKTLALYARRWANQVKEDCDKARHSDKKMYGECFFLGTNGTAEDALCSWEKEEDIYDKVTNTCTPGHNVHDCGHFAIMINKEWKWVGCGRAPCTKGPREGQFFISCSYAGAKPNNTEAASTP